MLTVLPPVQVVEISSQDGDYIKLTLREAHELQDLLTDFILKHPLPDNESF